MTLVGWDICRMDSRDPPYVHEVIKSTNVYLYIVSRSITEQHVHPRYACRYEYLHEDSAVLAPIPNLSTCTFTCITARMLSGAIECTYDF